MLKIFQNIRPISAIYVLVIGILLRLPAIIFGGIEGAKIEVSMIRRIFCIGQSEFYIVYFNGFVAHFYTGHIF